MRSGSDSRLKAGRQGKIYTDIDGKTNKNATENAILQWTKRKDLSIAGLIKR